MAASAIENALHELIDLASGHKASLPRHRALQLHEDITPGYTAKPLTDAEKAHLAELQDRQEREKADAEKAEAEKADAGKARKAG